MGEDDVRRVALSDLQPGMKLAQDITRPDGAVLARTGAELNEGMVAMIRRLSELGSVMIEGSSFTSEKERLAWQKEQLKDLIHRFSKVADDPVMQRLRKLESERIMNVK